MPPTAKREKNRRAALERSSLLARFAVPAQLPVARRGILDIGPQPRQAHRERGIAPLPSQLERRDLPGAEAEREGGVSESERRTGRLVAMGSPGGCGGLGEGDLA